MELDITFSCRCGSFVDETVYCDGPDTSAEGNAASRREYWMSILCSGCGKDFNAHVLCTLSDTKVHVPDVADLSYDVRDYVEEEDVAAEIEATRQFDIYRKVSTDVVKLLRQEHPEDVRATLNNMLFAQVVTAVEAYLSSSFIATVVKDDTLIRKLVETDPDLAKRQFSLREIFTQWEQLKFLVARYLKDLIFHDLKKVKPMYASVLDIDFGDVAWLFRAVLIRHDCVHRNGFDKDGTQHEISSEAILDLVRNSTHLVSGIEESLLARQEP